MIWGDEKSEEQSQDSAGSRHWPCGNPVNFCVYSSAQPRPRVKRALGNF